MLKKTVVLGSLLTGICASPTLAHSSYFKSGFLAGGHVGYSYGSGTFNANLDPNMLPALKPSAVSGRASKSMGVIGIVGGYRHIFNQGYTIGMDITGNFFTNSELKKQFTQIFFPFNNKLSRQFNVIPSIMFGKILYDRFHVALGLGLGISRFKLRVDAVAAGASFNDSQTRLGFVPSVGVEYAYTQNVSVIGNVSYEIYQKMKKTFQNFIPIAAGSTYTSSISPKYLTLKAGVVYRF